MWDNLDLDRKRKWIQFFVRNGITDRQRMKSEYDAMYLKKMEDVAQQNYANWGYDSPEKALVHALNDNTYDYNKWFADNPGSTENSDTHWSDGYKTVYHPTFSDESMYSGVVDRNYNPEGRVGGYWDQDGEFVPASWQDDVEYKKGGSINIKHPGRLTELKKRTGKTEAELYNDGNPAHKKMVVFARNARQWNHKHQLGGNVDNWMSWWYKNRTPQLVSNFDEYYNVGSSGYEPIADRAYEANLLVGDALNDVAGIGVHKAPLAGDLNGYLSENVYGGEPKIVLGYDERPDIELHEKTHYLNHLLGDCYNEDGRSYFNSPFQMAIGDVTTGDLFEDENGRYQHDEYLDNQDEIYSRLNQIRYRNGLDPKKKYTEKEIEDMRRKGMLTLPNGDGLERYTNKFIQHLLNDVAYNNAYDSNTSHYAANGGHLFQGYSDSKLRFVNNQPVIYNDKGVLLPDITIKPENESLFTYDENGVPTASDTLKQEVAYWGTPQGMVEAAFNRADKKTAQQERAENYEKYGPIVGDVMNQGPVSSYLTGITNYVTDHTKRAFTHPWQTFKEDLPMLQYWIPGWRTGLDLHDIKNDVANADYGSALFNTAALLLPFRFGKAVKKGKQTLDIAQRYKKYVNWSDAKWDNEYFKALNKNDIGKAMQLRDAHFAVKSPGNKAVDKHGKPLMLYHSGEEANTFNAFDPKHEGKESFIYGATNALASQTYASKSNPSSQIGSLKNKIRQIEHDIAWIQKSRDVNDPKYANMLDGYNRYIESLRNQIREIEENTFANLTWNNGLTKTMYGYAPDLKVVYGNGANWNELPIVAKLPRAFTKQPWELQQQGYLPKFIEFTGNPKIDTRRKKIYERALQYPMMLNDKNSVYSVGKFSTRHVEDAVRKQNRDAFVVKDIYDNGSTPSDFFINEEKAKIGFGLNKDAQLMDKSNWNSKYITDIYGFRDPKRLKSADYITYDDNGNIIPLSQRDNFNLNNLNYGLIPAVGLGLYGLQQGLNDQKEYANGGHLFQGTKDSTIQTPKLTFQGGKPYLTNDVGTFLPQVSIQPEQPERPGWFARQSMNAAMADNAPFMQAVGWEQDRDGNYHQDPTTQGARELSKALFEIGLNGATDVILGPVLEKAVESGIKGVKAYRTAKAAKAAQKAGKGVSLVPESAASEIGPGRVVLDDIDDVMQRLDELEMTGEPIPQEELQLMRSMFEDFDQNLYTPEQNLMRDLQNIQYNADLNAERIVHDLGQVQDISRKQAVMNDIAGYLKPARKIEDLSGNTHRIYREPLRFARRAEGDINHALYFNLSPDDALGRIGEDFAQLPSKGRAELIGHDALSTDSYPFFALQAARKHGNEGTLKAVRRFGKPVYQKLNDMGRNVLKGKRYTSAEQLERLNKVIDKVNKTTGLDIPHGFIEKTDFNDPSSIFENIYMPALSFSKFGYGGHIFDGPDESQAVTVPPKRKPMKTIGQKAGQKLVSQIFNPNGNIGDAIGWAADVAGVPSSVTNAARDVWNRAHNAPVILANAAYNKLSEKERGNDDYSWAQAFMDADTNPGWLARAMLTYPLTNTASNYTDEELANMHQADLWSKGKDKYGNPIVEGQIVHDAYRTYNGGDYAKNVKMKVQSDNPEEGEKELSFLKTLFNPMKAVEWSLGQTSGIDIDGQRTTFDRFAFDIDDTVNTYADPKTLGMRLRKTMGHLGSLGYPDNTDSATSIVTKVPVRKQKEAYEKFKNRKDVGGHLFQYAGEMYTPRTDENGFLNYAYPMTLQYGNDTAQDTVVEPVFLDGIQEQMQDNANQTYGFHPGMTVQDIPTIDSVIGETMYWNVHDSDRTTPVYSYGNEKLDERKNTRFETFVDDNGVIQTVDRFANYRMLPDDAFGELQRNANSIKNTQDRDRIMSEYESLPKGVYSENTMKLQKELLDNGFYDDIIENKVGTLGRSGRSKIRDTQRMLLENGYYENGTDSDVDGVFGDRSKSAYRKYLADSVVDGIAGNDTKQAIYRYYDANAQRNQNTLHDVKAYAKQCARYVREFAQNNGIDTWGSGVYGDAWTMFGNINDRGGDVYYNIYDKSFDDVDTPKQLRKKTEQALKDNKIDYSMLKQGDIVGIYIPSSGAMQSAIDEGYTKNTHVGIVDHIEDGMPVIRHNINGKARLDKADKLTGSTWGKAQITVAARPKSSTMNRGGLPELKWNDNAKSDMVYEFEHPEQVSEKRKNMVSEYMDGLAGAKDNMEMLFPNVDMDIIEKAAIGILRREGNFMETEEGDAIQNVSNFARGIMKSDEDRTVRTSGLKLSSFTERERNMLGIKSRKDLDGSLKKQARGVMYILSKNYDYMKRYAKRHPELGMTDDEILGFALIGFNQGMGKLYAINPESIEEFRKTSFNNEYRFPISYNEKPVGQVLGSLARRTENVPLIGSINGFINDKAMEEYDSMGYGKSYKPYAIDVFDSMQNVVPRDLAQNQMGNGGQIIWDNNGQWSHPGQITGITGTQNGTDITMNGVADYLYGIDNYGNGGILVPGQDYHFPGDKVVEYPITSHKHQFGGLLGESDFGNMAALAQLQGARAGLPMDFDVVAPFLTQGNVQQSYYPYETEYVPRAGKENEKEDYKKFSRDKKKFVEESFDNWYDTFAGHGHSHDDSVRMAKFFALQDAYESGYGNKMSVENNNFGGMNDVKEARRQGVHFVPIKYKTKKDYYEAKYNDIARKWSGALLPETVTIEDFYNALHANPAYQYAPKDVNPNYLNSLLGMKSAQKWIDEYSANYGRGFQEGGLAKPFSYKQLPVVRFDNGGHAYIAK